MVEPSNRPLIVKVESLNFSDQLTSAIQRSLAGNDIDWNRAIIND